MTGLTRKEELILLTIRVLKRDAYLVAIGDHLAKMLRVRVTLPSVHIPLRRLEKAGFIESELGEGTTVRGGRRKKIYRITPSGFAALVEHKRLSEAFWAASPVPDGQKS